MRPPKEILRIAGMLFSPLACFSVASVILSGPAFAEVNGPPPSRARVQGPPASVEISGAADHLTVHAVGAPLSLVLKEVARSAGIIVIYDGPPPQDPVTVTLINGSGTDIILDVLEGTPCNFAARWDQRGTRMDMILLSAAVCMTQPDAEMYAIAEPIEPAQLAAAAELKAVLEGGHAVSAGADLSTSRPSNPDRLDLAREENRFRRAFSMLRLGAD